MSGFDLNYTPIISYDQPSLNFDPIEMDFEKPYDLFDMSKA